MSKTTHLPRRTVLKTACAAAAAIALPVRAQASFPSKPLKIIVGLPPGGSADAIARAYVKPLESSLKQSVIVENRPGGQFKISMQALTSAPADGHTLLYVYNGYAAVQATEKLFDVDSEAVPVTQIMTTPIVLMVRADSPHKTMRDLLEHARTHPGKLNYGTLGPAGLEHLKMVQIEKAAGIQATAVPYRGGPDMLKALLGGEIDFAPLAGIFAKTYAGSGKLRALAVLDATRWREFPDLPTLAEAGVRVSPLSYWGGFFVKAGTAPDIVQKLFREITAATMAPEVVEQFRSTAHYAALSASPDELRRLFRSDVAWMGETAKQLQTPK